MRLEGWHLMVLPLIVLAIAAVVILLTDVARRTRQPAGQGSSVPLGYTTDGQPIYQQARTNTLAILALVFGFIFWPLGIIFGHVSLVQIKQTGESGAGLAIAGLVLGYIWLAIIAIPWLLSAAIG